MRQAPKGVVVAPSDKLPLGATGCLSHQKAVPLGATCPKRCHGCTKRAHALACTGHAQWRRQGLDPARTMHVIGLRTRCACRRRVMCAIGARPRSRDAYDRCLCARDAHVAWAQCVTHAQRACRVHLTRAWCSLARFYTLITLTHCQIFTSSHLVYVKEWTQLN